MPSPDDAFREDGTGAALAAIDATLAGDPVDPDYAELAELALILRDERPVPEPRFATSLDSRVARRFGPAEHGPRRPARRRRWLFAPGAAMAAALGVALVLVVSGGVSGSPQAGSLASSSSAASSPAVHGLAASGAASSRSAASTSAAQPTPESFASPTTPAAAVAAPAPVPSPSRKVVQSAQLTLQAKPKQIDAVAQQVFNVVASEKGYVQSSNVTATGTVNGYAQFQLSVPSANLQATMSALSAIGGSRVLSRTDATTDITGQIGGAGMKLAEARALRSSLLKQLAAATTTAQVDSLKAQLNDADASIASDLATLRKLQRQVAFSQVGVTIQAGAVIVPVTQSTGFTLHRALHDAGRVLVVAAGVALIVLAALVPVGAVIALVAWLALAVRRRRREHALDLV